MLAIYNPKRETELYCDASGIGYRAILLQKQDDGAFHPIAYFSKRTTEAETRYHSFELETLAIINALRRFRTYLEGIKFKIVTDCNSLTLTLNKKLVNSRIARWALELENFDYKIQHRSGAKMGHVDALSRCQANRKNIVAVVDSEDIDFRLQAAQARDPKITNLKLRLEKEERDKFEMSNDILYKKSNGTFLFYVPYELEQDIIRTTHEHIGHLGIEKCYQKIKTTYWFPDMNNKIDKFTKNCIRCIMYSPPLKPNE